MSRSHKENSSTPKVKVYPRYDKELNLIIRQSFEKQQVIFLVLKNVQQEVQQLRKEQKIMLTAFREILALDRVDPALAEKIKKETLSQMNHAYTGD